MLSPWGAGLLPQTVRPPFPPSQLSQTEQLDAGDVIRVGRRQGIWADHIGSSSEYFFLSFAASLRINSLSQTEVFVDEVGAVTCWDSGSGEKMYM